MKALHVRAGGRQLFLVCMLVFFACLSVCGLSPIVHFFLPVHLISNASTLARPLLALLILTLPVCLSDPPPSPPSLTVVSPSHQQRPCLPHAAALLLLLLVAPQSSQLPPTVAVSHHHNKTPGRRVVVYPSLVESLDANHQPCTQLPPLPHPPSHTLSWSVCVCVPRACVSG